MKTKQKHKSIAIHGSDLLDRVARDSDSYWRDVIGWNCAELDRLTEETDEADARRDELERREAAKVTAMWWIVSWPDHVSFPRYNSDAIYCWCRSEAEARREAAVAYGEVYGK